MKRIDIEGRADWKDKAKEVGFGFHSPDDEAYWTDDAAYVFTMKQIEEDPWLALPDKYPTGTPLGGVVRNLTSFGAFVEIEPGIDGLVHVSDMSWTRRVEHPSEVVQKGDEVNVMVLE